MERFECIEEVEHEEEIGLDQYLIDYKSELDNAKTFLQRCSPFTGDNLYDHLCSVLDKILSERPENVVDFFEEYSRQVRERKFRAMTLHMKNIYVPPLRYEYMQKLMPFLKVSNKEQDPSTADPEDDNLTDPNRHNLMLLLENLEKVGLGFSKTEIFCLQIAMRQLAKSEKLEDLRFWGQIFGLRRNYIVLEAVLNEEEVERRNSEYLTRMEEAAAEEEKPLDALEEKLAEIELQQEKFGEDGQPLPKSKIPRTLPPIPKSLWKPIPEAPRELCGDGVNKKVYYVCNFPGDEWVQLPDVTPQQIVVARQIVKYFTGYLDTEIVSYPAFDGTEKNLLRAQIARISAGTQISPLGYYTFRAGGEGGEEEEEEEEEEMDEEAEGGSKTSYKINPRYEPHPMTDLTDPTMSFWVHHTLYILPQGRTKWWNPYPNRGGGGGEEEELGEEEQEEDEGPAGPVMEPEDGPSLLVPLSDDASLEAIPPWSVRINSSLMPEHAMAIVRSNLWPGAYALSAGKMFENIYVGWGVKYFASNFSPTPLPPIEQEYPLGPEIMETTDPTGAQEEQWRLDHEKKPEPPKAVDEEGGEEEEEEEEEDEDEDDDDD